MSNIQIYSYINPIEFLKSSFQLKQEKNPRFSIRSWARDLDISEPTILSQILNGKRSIPEHYVEKFSKGLKLDEQESQYLHAIVELSKAKTDLYKILWTKKAQRLSFEASSKFQEISDLRIFEGPLHMSVLNLTQIKGFQNDCRWIQKKLLQNYSLEDIQSSIDFLLEKNLIKRDDSGRIVRTSSHVSSKQDVASIWIKKFHEKSLKEAAKEIYVQPLDQREYGSYILCIDQRKLSEIKNKIRAFTTEILSEYTAIPGEGDALYQFNINFISRSTKEIQ